MGEFSECPVCHQKLAALLWIKVFSSVSHAKLDGQGPEFLSSFLPPSGLLKIILCMGCATIKPSTEFTPEEVAELKKHAEDGKKYEQSAEKLGKIFGAFGK